MNCSQSLQLLQRRLPSSFQSYSCRLFVKVGDVIPVNYLKDEPLPKVLEDSSYPPWLSSIAAKGPTKSFLLEKMQANNGAGLETMSVYEKRRLKRLITLDTIKENNMRALVEK